MESSLEHGPEESEFHMHYDGEAPLRKAEEFFGRRSGGEAQYLLDIGCGFGGTVQHFAKNADFARIVGVDVQQELIHLADRLLAGCDMANRKKCALACADFTKMSPREILGLTERPASAVISLNVFVHLDRTQMTEAFRLVDQVLAADGKMYIEDFCLRGVLSAEERQALTDRVGCPYLPTQSEYRQIVRDVNSDWKVDLEDISASYSGFARKRLQGSLDIVDLDPVEREFYQLMDSLLSTGVMGGVKITMERG
ncbi:cyclopropane-fatty-acyl-phospholipid synthase family protein [Streptomyces sp. UNOC14_S4]|uniref:SAM-dependent methyltransferase n=1 Tax=Streptomyces sp. UNOC14_S4 TaxID=2872340 RepID=UPI001E4E5542|nr:class I SAM-dependent methyltransferase [Streptomyces sp. UNOC14_S4]MCC3770518.1 class I SAM-dependent methyltransferase [Streptomyces sp. UNOC14_S4]